MIKIKEATKKDVKEANKLLTMLIKDEQKYDENIKDDFKLVFDYEAIYKDNYLYFAYDCDKVVGYLYGYLIDDNINKYLVGKLDALYVLPEYRNKKIANTLIDNFIKWCNDKNVKIISVKVFIDNLVAKHLYIKYGFLPKTENLYKGYKPKKYQKLVRDKIPEIISKNNEEPVTRILNDLEYKEELEKKLYEEYIEVLQSFGDARLEELADMLEVMISLAKLENKNLEDLLKVQKEKELKRGGFSKRLYLENVK